MTGEILSPRPFLEISPEKEEGLETALGPEGHGAFIIRQAIPELYLEPLMEEVMDPELVQFRDNHAVYKNKRKEVIQNHDVYALKLLQGDSSYVERLPRLRQLTTEIEQYIQSLDQFFPSLATWTVDEVSLQRYDRPEEEDGLGFHFDNTCFWGVVAVATLEGSREYHILLPDGKTVIEDILEPGDLALTRVLGLFESNQDIRAEHAAKHLKTPFSTAFIVRANNLPNKVVDGFNYDNWDLLPPDNPYAIRLSS